MSDEEGQSDPEVPVPQTARQSKKFEAPSTNNDRLAALDVAQLPVGVGALSL